MIVTTDVPTTAPLRPGGHLALIGGALDENVEILDRIVTIAAAHRERSGREHALPRIAILTTASEPASSASDADNPECESDLADGVYYAELFARHGAVGVPIPVGVSERPPYPGATYLVDRAEQEAVADLVRSCDGVFFGGGDQSHYVLALFRAEIAGEPPFANRHETAALQAIHSVLESGGVVAGTSAGLAIQQGRDMVSGGEIHTSWALGSAPGRELAAEGREALSYIPAGGLDFFPEAPLDSHFSEWGRPPRAIRLAHDTGKFRTIGVDEHTALFYDRATRQAQVIGKRGVSFLDLAECEGSGDTILGTRWSYLVPGDTYDFVHDRASRGTAVVDLELENEEASASTSTDLWTDDGSRPLLRLALSLLASNTDHSAHGESDHARSPRFRTTLHRDERTVSFSNGGFSNLTISITPTPTTH